MSVYFITARQVGMVKIGCAYTPAARMKDMQIGCPVELVLEATFKGAYREEKEFHDKFSAHRIRGEWFTLTPEIEALIAGAVAQGVPFGKGSSQKDKLNGCDIHFPYRRLIRELAGLEEVS